MLRDGRKRACAVCGGGKLVSRALGVCAECIREGGEEAAFRARRAHEKVRARFGDPVSVPRTGGLEPCGVCANACSPPEGGAGYCAVRTRKGGAIGLHDGPSLSWYHDPLPTNCVADFVCPGGTGAGYPQYSSSEGPEVGMKNLAVFYHSCSFDCLFCQNWHFREVRGRKGSRISPGELADAVDETTSCICFFGGEPGTQVEHALEASREARRRAAGRPLRVCWETNGSASPEHFEEMVAISLESGGCVKVDLKAFDESLHRALTGASNGRTLRNFRLLARLAAGRPDPPLAVASTLMVPGYVEAGEVGRIAGFLAELDPSIPYALLAFHPDFVMSDLPATPRSTAEACLEAARRAGLEHIHLGNIHLL